MAKDDELRNLQAEIKKILDEQNSGEISHDSNMSDVSKFDAALKREIELEMKAASEQDPPSKIDDAQREANELEMDEPESAEPNDIEVIGGVRAVEADVDDMDELEELDVTDENDESKTQKKKGSIWNRVLFIIGVLMIAYAAYSIGSLYWNYHESNQEYDDIIQEFVTTNTADDSDGNSNEDFNGLVVTNSENGNNETSSNPWYNEISVNMSGLQAKYSDVAGWLYQEGGTAISYPIMYNEDDVYYLHKTYKGTYAYAGSIFMETLNNRDFNDSNTIIYGHNMRNGSMFGTLKYLRKDGYMDTHGYFQIFLNDEIRRYQVFAYEVVKSDSWVYQVPFGETEAFTEYINKAISNSEVDTGVEVTNQDHIIVLSTCYGSNTDKRFVVFAVWMDTYYYDTGLTQSEMDAEVEDSVDSNGASSSSDTESGT